MKKIKFIFLLLSLIVLLSNCTTKNEDKKNIINQKNNKYQPQKYVELKHPEWSKNATLYQVNVRHFTKEGTFKAFESHLPRIKKMGIDIIWLMPIHPIGVKNRKGTLGSGYSVKDYYDVNPEFGDLNDLKNLIKKIHELGMYVILDWVANHSAWDNPLTTQHPEWYTKSKEGNFQPTPWYDWDDIIDFDFEQEGIRKYMTDALKYWVKETNIDGYRCDVAGFIPIEFWENVRTELDEIKPVFMLAEWEARDLHKKAFDMTYAWSLWDKMRSVTLEKKNIGGLVEYMAHDVSSFPKNAYRMTFTENHDKNAWEGTQYSNFGEGLEACMVLTSMVNGMPMVYGGQEAGLDRSLAFFEKDLIDWKKHKNEEIYTKLFELKHKNQALWNGEAGGEMVRVFSNQMDKVISFVREKNGDKVFPIINFSDKNTKVTLQSKYEKGEYKELFSQKIYNIKGDDIFELKAWEYLVLVKQK